MIRSIIFDFDGVIVDTEPIHLRAFKEILRDKEIYMEDSEYYSKYLAYDDLTFFTKSLQDYGKYTNEKHVKELVKEKSELIKSFFQEDLKLFPGIEEFIGNVSGNYILAIGSGALRSEIEEILDKFNLRHFFSSIISADEVEKCKPDPEVYLKVLQTIRREAKNGKGLQANQCIVIEDSVYGISAAKEAGMKCIAVTNSYGADKLSGADKIVETFSDFDYEILNSL